LAYRILLLALLLFLGCEKKDFTKEPAKMHWDRDMCERCKMAISDRKFAVQGIDERNRVYRFDDIGCLVLWQRLEHPDIKFKKIWITDAKTGRWIDAKKACFKRDFLTPMGYGYGAVKDESNGSCLSYEDIKKEIK